MNSLTKITDQAATMTSIEISELVESRHDKVKQSIERLAGRGIIELPPTGIIQTSTKPTTIYNFSGEQGKRDSIIVVAQLSPEFTAKLVDRWHDLETGLAIPAFAVPKNYADALRLAADQQEELEKQQLLIEEQSPKVEFYDAVTGSSDVVDMGEVAKIINYPNLGRNNLFALLRELKVLMKNNQPYQQYCDRGYFRVIESKYNKPDGSISISLKTVVFQKGLDFIRKLIDENCDELGTALIN